MLRATGGQLRSFLNITLTESSTYEELRSIIARWDASQTKWQNPLSAAFGPDSNKNGVADMEIDRVGEYKGGKKGKGKGKGKDNKGKGKGGKSSFHDYNQQLTTKLSSKARCGNAGGVSLNFQLWPICALAFEFAFAPLFL